MGKSFFRGTDAELYAASNVFAAKILASFGALGLTEQQAVSYGELNAVWRAAYKAAINPGTRTRGKVAAKNSAKAAVKVMAADLAKIIAGTGVTDEQKIDLGLSVRAQPTPGALPGEPTRLRVELSAIGTLGLKWSCTNPPTTRGTVYQIWRKIGGGEFVYLGMTGRKRFVDETLPAGSSSIMYQIQAMRSTVAGPCATFNVNFGVTGSAKSASVVPAGPVKMAA
jgi:hypothetical protein